MASWICRSRFRGGLPEAMFGGMDSEAHVGGGSYSADDPEGNPRLQRGPGWSIAVLIQLLDDAIDSAGAQLARSAGLWVDSPEDRSVFRAPDGRRPVRVRSLSARALLEESDADRVIETP